MHSIPGSAPPVETGASDGPYGDYRRLLERCRDARRRLHAAQVCDTPEEASAAGWDVTEAEAAVLRYEQEQADALLLALRFAALRRADALTEIIGGIACITELADAVAALEAPR